MKNVHLGTRCTGALIAALLCLSSTRAVAEPTAQDRETARTLLFDGRQKMAGKEYEAALKSFRAAHAIMGVPTTGLDLARAQEALHMLVEARETATSVAKSPVQAGESNAFASARTAAAELAAAIGPRIPALQIVVNGMSPGIEPSVLIDGAALPQASIGFPRKLNPGKHSVQVTANGFTSEKREVELREGEARTETIELKPGTPGPTNDPETQKPGVPSLPPGPPAVSVTAAMTAAPLPSSEPQGRTVPVWAWISGGAGLAAAGVSVGFLVDHLDARQTLARDCPSNVCDPAKYDLEKMNRLRGRWNRDLSLFVGAGAVSLAALGVAVFGIVSAPCGAKPKTSLQVAPWAGLGGGGIAFTGDF